MDINNDRRHLSCHDVVPLHLLPHWPCFTVIVRIKLLVLCRSCEGRVLVFHSHPKHVINLSSSFNETLNCHDEAEDRLTSGIWTQNLRVTSNVSLNGDNRLGVATLSMNNRRLDRFMTGGQRLWALWDYSNYRIGGQGSGQGDHSLSGDSVE